MDFTKIDLSDHQSLAREIMRRAAGQSFRTRREFEKFRNGVIKEFGGEIFHNLYFIQAYRDLVAEGEIEANAYLLSLIQKRAVRTMSGVAPVTVLTKPFPCPGRCIYCPTDVRMPKSYLASQPAAQRGLRQQFNPYTQVFVRLKALMMTGHEVSKVELRVLGGTWSSYPADYQEWFIKMCLLAMNEFSRQIVSGVEVMDGSNVVLEPLASFSSKGDLRRQDRHSLLTVSDHTSPSVVTPFLASHPLEENDVEADFDDVVKANETADVRCIGINVETRPDFINAAEIGRLRRFGVTKIELGVQRRDDDVQEMTKRGHGLAPVREGTGGRRDAGFKVSYHMMPNLPGATMEGDKRMVGELFANEGYQPDYLKIYPCMVIPGTELADLYAAGGFRPYSDEELCEVLYAELKDVPEWCRVDRVARDIPANEIAAGSKKSNVRQILDQWFVRDGVRQRDIRAREIYDGEVSAEDVQLVVRRYPASGGEEVFLSYEDVGRDKLIALLRLRFPGSKVCLAELTGAALVREVHVYGKQVKISSEGDLQRQQGEVQHGGFGSKLLAKAEELALEAGFKRVAVIAGIGTREYYRKFGYELDGSYVVKGI